MIVALVKVWTVNDDVLVDVFFGDKSQGFIEYVSTLLLLAVSYYLPVESSNVAFLVVDGRFLTRRGQGIA